MDERGPGRLKPAMTYGLTIAAVLIGLNLVAWLFKLDGSLWFQYLNWAVLVGVLYWALKSYRDQHLGGFITYGRAVRSGLLFFFFASLLYGFYTVLYFAYLDPEAIDRGLDAVEELYYARGISEEQIDRMMQMATRMRSPGMQVISVVFGTTMLGLILSLLISVLVRRKGDPFAEAMRNVPPDTQA